MRGLRRRDHADDAEHELRTMRRVAHHPAGCRARGRSTVLILVTWALSRRMRSGRTALHVVLDPRGFIRRAERSRVAARRHGRREQQRELQHGQRKRARGEATAEQVHELKRSRPFCRTLTTHASPYGVRKAACRPVPRIAGLFRRFWRHAVACERRRSQTAGLVPVGDARIRSGFRPKRVRSPCAHPARRVCDPAFRRAYFTCRGSH